MEDYRPHLSIVTTVYQSEAFLETFMQEVHAALQEIDCRHFEVIAVNDGSPDASLERLLALKHRYPNLIIIDLSKNFGHHHAMLAGLAFSKGEYVFLIDCDLESPPRELARFYRTLRESDCDSVYGYQESRKGGLFERWSGSVYWNLFNLLSETPIPANLLTTRMMRRNYVDAVVEMGDKNLFLGGMFHWIGFSQVGLAVATTAREGRSTYTLRRKAALFVNSLTSFSAYPLQLIFHAGISITAFTFTVAFYLAFQKIFFSDYVVGGWTSLVVLMAFSLGIIMTCLGVIGLYLSKLYIQTQNRPLYLVRDVY